MIKRNLNFPPSYCFLSFSSRKIAAAVAAANPVTLLLAEGHAVGAGILSRIALMGAHQDTIQRTVVLLVTMVCTGAHSAFNALVGVAVHGFFLLPVVWH